MSGIAKSVKYAFHYARALPELFMSHDKFPKASIVTWVNSMKTMLPGCPQWGRNAVSRIRLIYIYAY